MGTSAKDLAVADVARVGFDAMMNGDGDVVSGWKRNKLQSAIANVTPAGIRGEASKVGEARSGAKDK